MSLKNTNSLTEKRRNENCPLLKLDFNERQSVFFFSTQILYDDRVAPTLTSSGESVYWPEKRNINDTEYRRMSTFPSDFDFGNAKVRYVCGMSVPPMMTAKIAEQIKLQWFESNNELNTS